MGEREEREEESVSIETTHRVKKVKFADMVEVDTDIANDNIKDKQSEQASSSIEHKVPNEYQEVCFNIIVLWTLVQYNLRLHLLHKIIVLNIGSRNHIRDYQSCSRSRGGR